MWAFLFGIDSRAKTVKLAIGKIGLLSVDANDVPRPGRLVAFIPKSASPDELVATLTPRLRKE